MAEAAPQTASSEFKPHLFGKFFLLQRLAVGGMAEIYRARVPGADGFEKELVVKRILRARAQDQNFTRMLVNEAKLTVQLTHSYIAQVYECGKIEGDYFISMELVNGVSMKEMMHAFARAGAQLSPEQAIFIVLQLLQGLAYAHRKTDPAGKPLQIVHCDVSPDNCLLSWEGEVKLLDFGIARAATGLSNYKEGMLMGKLGYVAPEQASLEKRWDHRVDIFAAGIILYELLTKQKPFPRATDVESLIESRRAKVVPPTSIDPRLPKDVDAIVAKALAYDPEDRYADARSFADALVDVLFPTPHSSIQDHLASQMKQVFVEKIARQRQGRAHDPLVMKVLYNAAQLRGPEELEPLGPDGLQAPGGFAPDLEVRTPSATPASPPRRSRRPRPAAREGIALSTAVAIALALAGGAVAAFHYAAPWLRPGVVVVTSAPSGAEIVFDGAKTGLTTPAVLERVVLSRPHQVTVGGGQAKETTVAVPLVPGALVARVHVRLESSLGSIVVESEPAGAEIVLDDKPVGRTPQTIRGVRLDRRHRIDLVLAGHEIDQFVVMPEKDGVRYARRLSRVDARARRAEPPP